MLYKISNLFVLKISKILTPKKIPRFDGVKDRHQTPQLKIITAGDKGDKKQLSSNASSLSQRII